MNDLHVALIGTGRWSRTHLRALTDSPHVSRVTLAGRNEPALAERSAEFPIVTRLVLEPAQIWDDPSVDVVDIVVPHHLHAPLSIAALEAGKHVICEKPGATRLDELDRALAAADRCGKRLLIVMNHLYNPLVHRVRELIDAAAIGRPFLSVENAFSPHAADYLDPRGWRTRTELAGGGVLIDGGFHMVYRHLYYLAGQGSPAWVTAETAQLGLTPDGAPLPDRAEDFVSITVGWPQPLRIAWTHGWSLPAAVERRRQSFLAGTLATLELLDSDSRPLVLHRGKSTEAVEVPPGPRSGPESTHACLVDYLDCLATGRIPKDAQPWLARRGLSVVLAAYASARQGRRVMLEIS